MKKTLNFTFALMAAFAAIAISFTSCSKETDVNDEVIENEEQTTPGDPGNEDPSGDNVTITVTIPEDLTKVSFVPDADIDAGGLTLYWKSGDKIDINGVEFRTTDNNTKTATFTSSNTPVAVDGKYTITYAGNQSNAGDISYTTQHQTGNGSTAHLKHAMQLTGVDDYANVEFSDDWAEEHDGTLKKGGVLRLRLQVPSDESPKIDTLFITAASPIFYSDSDVNPNNKTDEIKLIFDDANGCDISNADASTGKTYILTAYMVLPWADVELPSGTNLTIGIVAKNHDYFHGTFTTSEATTFGAGKVGAIKLAASRFTLDDFARCSGNGTSASQRYLVGNPRQLLNVDSHMVAGSTRFFKLIDGIDMSGKNWALLNNPSPYNKLIDFDGNNKTISNLGGTMFYVFKGSIKNLTLNNPTITSGGQKGGLAQYIQGSGHTISNVDIKNVASFEGSTGNGGGLIGRINSGTAGAVSVTITDCDIENVPVTCATAGGLIGRIENKVVVSNCTYSGNTVTGTSQYVGGLVGNITTDDLGCSFTGCRVENATIDASAITADARAGGLLSYVRPGVTVKGCQVGTETVHVAVKTANKKANDGDNKYFLESGGFVGFMTGGTITKDDSGNHCKAYVTVTSANTIGEPLRLGGFVGYITGGTIEYCDAETTMLRKNDGSGDLEGQHVGGFAGVLNGGTIDQCTVKTDIHGNNWTAGFIGVGYSGVVTNCKVLSGSTVNGQSGVGGFVGETRNGSTWENNTVTAKVTARNTNCGGFVGICGGGELTSNSASGTATAAGPCGGFVGKLNAAATLEDCSASGSVSSSAGYGGGFAGDVSNNASLKNCYATGAVTLSGTTAKNFFGGFAASFADATADGCYSTGNITVNGATCEYVGGFIGVVKPGAGKKAKIQNSYSTGSVTAAGRWIGGFIGYIYNTASACGDVEIFKCHSSSAVSVTGQNYVGGFIGRTYMVSGSKLSIERCYATGNVTSNQQYASAFIGEIGETTNCEISDCYASGNIINSNQIRGGLIAAVNANASAVVISRCYASGEVTGSFRLGGLIGNLNLQNSTVQDCAAWNNVTASSIGNANWSSGAIIGTAYPSAKSITNNFRSPSAQIKAFWGNVSGYTYELSASYDHPDVDGSSASTYLVVRDKSNGNFGVSTTATFNGGNYPIFPYHGKHIASGTSLSTLASTAKASGGLGWSSDVWDFTGDLPTLK